VRILDEGYRGTGRYDTEWSGVDGKWQKVKSGVYFIQVSLDRPERVRCSSKVLQRVILTR